ncbi:hypothetical protein [Dyella subtropica]|uniref:hypothetical protein n=1 Tax=Dyella subtropica TaxID=2992127 RepID=UPI00225A8AEB|nr:hypothetical protein [Dyella subtropica]
MSLDAASLFALLPAVYRTRDAASGGALQALFEVLAAQSGIVEDNIQQLYDDQFIETCAPWVIPYIGDLIGYHSIYQTNIGTDSRAEIANTIGYRRRKGTPVALQQVVTDVSGRPAVIVEEFKRLITTESMRHPRLRHAATLDLRSSKVVDWLNDTAFDHSNRTIDVRRIAPRIRTVTTPDTTPLNVALHGPGRFNIPDVAVHLWRWRDFQVTQSPASVVDPYRYRFNPIGLDIPLFLKRETATEPFQRMNTRMDVTRPIHRREFARHPEAFYGPSLMLFADDVAVDVSQICVVNLDDRPGGQWCKVPAGKIAIDPELGRIQFAADLTPPQSLRVSYHHGFPADIGGGGYDRSASLADDAPTRNPAQADFFALVGTPAYPDLETAVAQWNLQAPGATGLIVLPGFERYAIALEGSQAITLAPGSRLALVAGTPQTGGAAFDVVWSDACVTLVGNLQVTGLPPAPASADPPPPGQLLLSGLLLDGQLTIDGSAVAVQLADCTLVPGFGVAHPGLAPCEPNIVVRNEASLCMVRCICGPLAVSAAGSVRITSSIVDATSPCCVAYAGVDEWSAGADLHVEDSTIVGKLRTRTLLLASNTLFFARRGAHDPWPAALWCSRTQVGCVRFCSLPGDAITPRRYECLPPTPEQAAAFEPRFVALRYGHPSYALLSGDVPLAVWRGADNGSQIGAYLQIEETEAVSNAQIRTPEYLPVALESGVFLHPSRPPPRPVLPPLVYGMQRPTAGCCGDDDDDDGLQGFHGIGVDLL